MAGLIIIILLLRHSGACNIPPGGIRLSDNTVSCIAEDPDNGNLWIGTNDGGLNYYNRKTGVFSYYRTGTSANA
jgi:hypothetical protein